MSVLKKILFVGKFNVIFQDINNYFENLFSVQLCVDNAEMVKNMMKVKQPELVVVSLIGISSDAEKLFTELQTDYPNVPVICIGTDSELNMHMNYINSEQFTRLTRPINNEDILDAICKILDVTYKDGMIVDNKTARKLILLVDDDGMQLRAHNGMLKDKYDIRMATSGMQALTLIGKKKPDLIFLDYEMPVCDGRMTLEMIRELEEAKDIPVVFLTGVNDKEHIQAVLKLKPSGYLLKPADPEMIFGIIDKIFG